MSRTVFKTIFIVIFINVAFARFDIDPNSQSVSRTVARRNKLENKDLGYRHLNNTGSYELMGPDLIRVQTIARFSKTRVSVRGSFALIWSACQEERAFSDCDCNNARHIVVSTHLKNAVLHGLEGACSEQEYMIDSCICINIEGMCFNFCLPF